ncbi:hypothetical protein L7F22_011759 [Adiantum nelumboides]|nr:hypothetical protein [Adiantum nelumboides]
MPRRPNPLWAEHTNVLRVVNTSGQAGSGTRTWVCKYCGEQMTSTITRVLKHLTGIGTTGHCGGCEAVPPALRDALILEHFPPGSTASSQSGGARAAAIAAEDALQDALLATLRLHCHHLQALVGRELVFHRLRMKVLVLLQQVQVIFTNESNIDRWKNNRQKAVDSKIGRLKGFMKLVDAPMQVFISCGKEGTGDLYRKPKHGMWILLERYFNEGVVIDKTRSFYVGDAAGRPNDHSDADLGFAMAAGLEFLVPEDVFVEKS